MGRVEQGLEIVRACRDRYDGRVRNPFDEYECGHWYARAMSSYAMLQGLTGARYDAVAEAAIHPIAAGKLPETFPSTATGYGTVGVRQKESRSVEVKSGTIDVQIDYSPRPRRSGAKATRGPSGGPALDRAGRQDAANDGFRHDLRRQGAGHGERNVRLEHPWRPRRLHRRRRLVTTTCWPCAASWPWYAAILVSCVFE